MLEHAEDESQMKFDLDKSVHVDESYHQARRKYGQGGLYMKTGEAQIQHLVHRRKASVRRIQSYCSNSC